MKRPQKSKMSSVAVLWTIRLNSLHYLVKDLNQVLALKMMMRTMMMTKTEIMMIGTIASAAGGEEPSAAEATIN